MRLTLTAAALALASTLGIGAMSAQGQNPPAPIPAEPGQPTQPGQSSRPSQPVPAPSSMGANREVTLTGCLARDTTKPATASQAAEGFMLTNARSTNTGSATIGTSASQAPGMGQQYRLMAKGDVNFAPHLNHQVRVTGTTMDGGAAARATTPGRGATTPGTSAGSTTGSTAGSAGSASTPAPMFHVTQLTMMSATCDTK